MRYLGRWAFLVSLFFCHLCYGNLEDHLKKVEGKGKYRGIQNIDFIYMINLDQRPEKFAQACGQLRPFGIYPYRFSAVNGWELPLEVINDVGLKYQAGMVPLMSTTFPAEAGGQPVYELMAEIGKTYFCNSMPRGSIGCALSHISILQDAWESGYETIWVMEDDIEVIINPHIMSLLIERLDALIGKENWDVLFTDRDYRTTPDAYLKAYGAAQRPDMYCSFDEQYSERYTIERDISRDFRKIAARFATHSMIIRRSGIKKLLDFAKEHQIYLAYDLDNYLVPGINRYSFTYDIVSNMINAASDNGTPCYEEKN